MKKLLIIMAMVALIGAVCISCGKDDNEVLTETESKNIIVVEQESQTVVTDKEEIANMVAEYGIPVDPDSIGSIVDTKIDASIFD